MAFAGRLYPHRIRLNEMWQLVPEDAAAGRGVPRYRVGPWSTQGLAGYRGPARMRRSFGRPRTIPHDERALLVIGGCDAPTSVLLNGEALVRECAPWAIARFDVTELLQRRNQLELRTTVVQEPTPDDRPFGGVLWGVELQMWPAVWVDYAFAVVTTSPSGQFEVTCVAALEGATAAEVRASARLYVGDTCLGESEAVSGSCPGQMRVCFRATAPRSTPESPSPACAELPWLVGARKVDRAEIFRLMLRVSLRTGQMIEIELPAGPHAPGSAAGCTVTRDLLAFVHAPELALSGHSPRQPVTVRLRTPPLTITSLPYLVARIAGHPGLAAWTVTEAGAAAEAFVGHLAELDPVHPVLRGLEPC